MTSLMPFPPTLLLGHSTPATPVSRIHRLARHMPAPGPLHQLFPLLGSLFPKIPLGLIYLLASEFWFKYYIVNETFLTTIFKNAGFSSILIPHSLIYIFLPPLIYNIIYLFNTWIVYYGLSLLKCKLHTGRGLSVFCSLMYPENPNECSVITA